MAQIPVNDFDDWIKLVADPKKNPNPPRGVVTFFGYLSDADTFDPSAANYQDATTRTRYRLYLSLQLDDYLVIQKDDIIHFLRVSNSPNTPLGGMLLWVKSDAVIEHVPLNSHAVQAGFLQGPIIASGFAQAQRNSQLAGGVDPGGGSSFACPGGGVSFACPGGGVSFACPGGGVSLVLCR